MSVVEVENLRVEMAETGVDIVSDVSFNIEAGELLGLVGESGSGKTTVGTALLAYARHGARITNGQVRIDGVDVLALEPRRLRPMRGHVMSFVPQDPMAALNPSMRIVSQLDEVATSHHGAPTASIQEAMEEVGLPSDKAFVSRFPHQLSGGQQQRILIAMAFMCRPKVVVLDEPTTGVDVTTQASLLETVGRLCRQHGTAGLYVTHDLAVLSGLVSRVMVMYAGRLAETGSRNQVFDEPAHPYTRLLLSAIPHVEERRNLTPIDGRAPGPGERPEGCAFAPRCPTAVDDCTEGEPAAMTLAPGHLARCLRPNELTVASARPEARDDRAIADEDPLVAIADLVVSYGNERVLHGVSLELRTGECLALVGESGSGKSTLCRTMTGLTVPDRGEIRFRGQPVIEKARDRPLAVRQGLQYIFQSPYNSLNPRRTVRETLENPVKQFMDLDYRAREKAMRNAMKRVSLSERMLDRYPAELSGGERQRVAITRALICEPQVLICDEITSALDVSVQASIIELLTMLRRDEDLAVLFVTHNLSLVRTIADRVCVLKEGQVVETGRAGTILDAPQHAYTRRLLSDTPRMLSPAALAPEDASH